jgi:hypothetical protein
LIIHLQIFVALFVTRLSEDPIRCPHLAVVHFSLTSKNKNLLFSPKSKISVYFYFLYFITTMLKNGFLIAKWFYSQRPHSLRDLDRSTKLVRRRLSGAIVGRVSTVRGRKDFDPIRRRTNHFQLSSFAGSLKYLVRLVDWERMISSSFVNVIIKISTINYF